MSDELFVQLSGRLAEAHRRVRSLDLPGDEKARATRRLLAITDASKHDIGRASQRLTAFLNDLDQGRIAAADGADGPEERR